MFVIDSIMFVWTLLNIIAATMIWLVEEYPAIVLIGWTFELFVLPYIQQFLADKTKK